MTNDPSAMGEVRVRLHPRLDGSHCLLIPATENQWRDHLQYLSDAETMEHLWYLKPEETPWTETSVKGRLKRFDQAACRGIAIDYAIVELEHSTIVGHCGIKGIEWPHRKGEFGIILSRTAWGRAIAPEAVLLVLRTGYEELKLHRIEFLIAESNLRSRRFFESIGCAFEGNLREAYPKGDTFVAACMYSLLSSEWKTASHLLAEKLSSRLRCPSHVTDERMQESLEFGAQAKASDFNSS